VNNTKFSVAPLSGGNVLWAIAYYFGCPALVVIGVGAILWSIVQDIKPYITEIETILAQRNSTIFGELKWDNHQETIRQKRKIFYELLMSTNMVMSSFGAKIASTIMKRFAGWTILFANVYRQRGIDTAPDKRSKQRSGSR
jgi:hypothetical protein